jgi:isoquinoline 1-oxidoreductase beta subunit
MDTIENPERRRFFKVSTAMTGGLLIGFYLPSARTWAEQAGASSGESFKPNAHLRIDPDNTVTIFVGRSEMGQGVYTSMPMLIGEELEVDWETIGVEAAPADKAFINPAFGIQATGGSTSVKGSWKKLRQVGAAARIMLTEAAADTWGVDVAACRAKNGKVIHEASGRNLSYGELASTTATLPPPTPSEVKLKSPPFDIIGTPRKRLDSYAKVTGKADFGIDVRFPGLLTVVVARPPVFGAKVNSFDAAQAKKVQGVHDVVQVESGVAVLADAYWPAVQGRKALKIEWDLGENANLSSEALRKRMAKLAQEPGIGARSEGDADKALAGAAKQVEGVYEVPYLAHACMEPLNCTVHIHDGQCEIWTGTQFQGPDTGAAAEITGLSEDNIILHTKFLGGGFGRRANPQSDFVIEAVQVAKASGKPVKVLWTREDDMTGGYYRPNAYNQLAGAVDSEGKAVAWRQRVVTQSIMKGTPFEAQAIQENGLDPSAVEGASTLPYSISNIAVDWQPLELGVPVQWWRSVGHSIQGFVTESFIDELAHAAGKDPYQFRRDLLAGNERIRRALDTVAEKAGWGQPVAKGRGRGIAVHESFGSVVGEVAEVSITDDGDVKVHKVVCAVDCGLPVNPNHIRAQAESAVIFALTAALYDEITFENGRVQQDNFDSYPMLRIDNCPEIEVHIVETDAEEPTGMGEPAVPPLAAAVTNAIFAATGKRIRRLPIDRAALKAG